MTTPAIPPVEKKTTFTERFIFGARFNWRKRNKFWRFYPAGVLETLGDAVKSFGLLMLVPVVPFLWAGLLIWRLTWTPFYAAKWRVEDVENLMEVLKKKDAP